MTFRKQIAVIAMLGAMSAAAIATPASAQISAQRAQALMACNQRAQEAYPTIVPEGHHGRSEVYAACMTEAGQLP